MLNTVLAMALITVGVALGITHNYIVKESSKRAYARGYSQAKKEEQIRTEAEIHGRYSYPYRPITSNTVAQTNSNTKAETKPKKLNIDETFMDELKANGRAAVKIQ